MWPLFAADDRIPSARRSGRAGRFVRGLRREAMPYERALGAAFQMLDLDYFRIGGEA
jgi:hypothetical protein